MRLRVSKFLGVYNTSLTPDTGIAHSVGMALTPNDLRIELAALEEALQADPRVRKINHLRALLSLYDDDTEAQPVNGAHDGGERSEEPVSNMQTRQNASPQSDAFKAVPKIQRFKEIAERELNNTPSAHRTYLLGKMVEAGVMGNEKDRMAAFASNMHQLKEFFESDGKGNFRLRRDQPKADPQPAGSGLFN